MGGQEVPLDAGVKLTGKVGRTELGLLNVLTGSTSNVDSENLMVGRFKQNILEQSYIGGIFTNGNPSSGPSSSTYGVDTRFATSDFLGNSQNFAVNAYAAKSDNGDDSDNNKSYGLTAHFPNDKYVGEAAYRVIEDDFNPALGFVQRNNVRLYRVGLSYNPRPKSFLDIQQMFHDIFYTEFENLDNGMVESRELHITPLDWHFRSGDSVHAFGDYDRTYERLFTPFQISLASFSSRESTQIIDTVFNFASARKRRFVASVRGSVGDFWSGTAEQVNTTFTYKLPPKFNLSLAANQTFAHLPEGDFITRIFTANVDYSVSPFLSFTNLVQYDNRSRNPRLAEPHTMDPPARTRSFPRLQPRLDSGPDGRIQLQAQDTKVSTKFQYTFRF